MSDETDRREASEDASGSERSERHASREDDAPAEEPVDADAPDATGDPANNGRPPEDEPESGDRRSRRRRDRARRNGDRDGFDPAEVDDVARNLGRREVERLFDILEAALTGPDRLDEESLDTLLTALESAIVDPASVDSEELDRMLALWEAVLVDATSMDDAERALSIFDAAGLDEGRDRRGLFQFLDRLGLDELLSAAGAEGTADALDARGTAAEGADPYRLARLVATVTRNATTNSGETSVRVATELARAAATAHSPAELLDESRDIALTELERLGVDTGVEHDARERHRRSEESQERTLREKGEALLEQSASLDYEEEHHPAYDHVVGQLAPDEARVLRLLATEGPEPSVDVVDKGWLPIGSTTVAKHLTMLGAKAGCRHEERTPAYLHNIERLGLVWFADEPVEDLGRYRVLEAQPPVEAAAEEATRAKMVRRSVHLTPFGAEFCREAFGVDVVDDATGPLGDVFPVD